jgi:hypothetical protein
MRRLIGRATILLLPRAAVDIGLVGAAHNEMAAACGLALGSAHVKFMILNNAIISKIIRCGIASDASGTEATSDFSLYRVLAVFGDEAARHRHVSDPVHGRAKRHYAAGDQLSRIERRGAKLAHAPNGPHLPEF